MKYSFIKIAFAFIFFFLSPNIQYSQVINKLIFSTEVRTEIDKLEQQSYKIFTDVPGFIRAIIAVEDKSYFLRIERNTDSGLEEEIFLISSDDVDRIKKHLVEFNPKTSPHLLLTNLSSRQNAQTELFKGIKRPNFDVIPNDTSVVFELRLIDETILIGNILSKNDSLIYFETLSGLSIEVSRSLIEEVRIKQGKWHENIFRSSDPNQSRLFFGPTARSLPGGSGYFSIYEIFFPFLAIGVTDNIILSGGFSLFPGAAEQMFYIAPKIRLFGQDNLDLATGIIYANVSNNSFGIAYGVGTYSTEKTAITFGIGWGYDDEWEFSKTPFLMFGAELKTSKSIKIITENWLIPGSESLLISFGLRFFGEYLAADFGFITSTSANGGFPFVPWLGFAYNF
ncbi:MAG: hypothetical protein K9J12_09610 [Melioribacteraceae bacterium]|nr:hypothetical protein [Melioribacteraceae bacterium]MCF8414330.1 hypothetical protein [Melioribacteraceae bacterium]